MASVTGWFVGIHGAGIFDLHGLIRVFIAGLIKGNQWLISHKAGYFWGGVREYGVLVD